MRNILSYFLDLSIQTRRLKIASVSENDYADITKLYADINNNSFATGVFCETGEISVEKRMAFDETVKTGFNLTAKTIDDGEFTAYLKGSVNKNIVWIYVFIVETSKRRSGFGAEMIEALSNYLKINGLANEMRLSVLEKNINAAAFWRSQGFALCKTIEKTGVCGSELSKINIFAKLL